MRISKKDREQIEKIIALSFQLYCECDHTKFENEEISSKLLANIEGDLWTLRVELEELINLKLREVEVDFKLVKFDKK